MANDARNGTVHVLSWIAKVLLALVFLMLGAENLSDSRVWIRVFDQIGFGQWFRYFTGGVQMAGAVMLLVPRTALVGVVLLMGTMAGALLVHALVIGIGPQTVLVGVLLLLLFAVGAPAFGDWRDYASRDSDPV